MLLILVAFVVSFFLFYDTCKLHNDTVNLEKQHYQQQSVLYSVDVSILENMRNELYETRLMHENMLSKYKLKLSKIEAEIQKEINEYKIENYSKINEDVKKEIETIDLEHLVTLIMEKRHD